MGTPLTRDITMRFRASICKLKLNLSFVIRYLTYCIDNTTFHFTAIALACLKRKIGSAMVVNNHKFFLCVMTSKRQQCHYALNHQRGNELLFQASNVGLFIITFSHKSFKKVLNTKQPL